MALDRDKKQVKTITSNPAHGLWARIIDDDKAEQVADRLMQPDMFSGWGIRTMSKSSINYNPMSYHNGSVWPHDNAIIIRGLKKYGFNQEAARVATRSVRRRPALRLLPSAGALLRFHQALDQPAGELPGRL